MAKLPWWYDDDEPDEFEMLDPTVSNLLRGEGYDTVEKVRKANILDLMRLPNMGRGSIEKVRRWLRILDRLEQKERGDSVFKKLKDV